MSRKMNRGERALYGKLYAHRQKYIRLLKTATKRRGIVEIMLADADKQMAEFREIVYAK